MKKVLQALIHTKLIWVILLCAIAFLFLTAATAAAAPKNSCGDYHHVQRGETLYSISRRYGVSISAVMHANPKLRDPDRIYAGTYLYIPCRPGDTPGPGGPGCRYVHHVQWGQTLGEIARHYRVNQNLIARANGITNLDLIFAGEPLCIP